MRIIAGARRGRWFRGAPKDLPVVPISARIKKSVFDILRPRLEDARVLDLFAGTGAVGLEALSRGAASAFFVDRDKRCLGVIAQNAARLGLEARAKVAYGDALQDLSWIPFRAGVPDFDLIYLGPPYRDAEDRMLALSTQALARVVSARLLAADGWLLLQRFKKEQVELPAELGRFRQQRYGDTIVEFFRRGEPGL